MLSSTVNNAGYEVGISFGSNSSISINGDSLNNFINTKQDKDTLLLDVYSIGSTFITTNNVNPGIEKMEGTSWTEIGSLNLGSETIYVWKRIG